MQGGQPQRGESTPPLGDISRIREQLRRLAEVSGIQVEIEAEAEINFEQNQYQNPNMAVERQRVMKEYARPIIGTATSCIQLGEAARNYELKNIHYSMLPSFYGLDNEDALTFIRDFYATVHTFPLQGLNEDQLRMRCFPYTLKDKAKTWLMTLPPGSLTTWEDVYNKFMGKFYSHQITTELRTKIATFAQMEGEPFHEAWERFKLLLIQCPHHHYPLELQNQFFYDGLTLQCQYMVDNAAGGAMGEKTAEETYELYEMLGTNSQQKSIKGRRAGIHEISSQNEMAMHLAELTKQVKLLATKNASNKEVCGVCGHFGHGANVCSFHCDTISGCEEQQVNLMDSYQPKPRNDPYSNTYNPGWRNHPNFSWRNNPNPIYPPNPRPAHFQIHV